MEPQARVRSDGLDLFKLTGRTAVVTGACGFFGQVFTRALLEVGARVIMMSRSETIHQQRQAYAEEFDEAAINSYQVDFYDRQALDAALRQLAQRDAVDVLVNNAYDMGPRTGFNVPEGSLEGASFEQWSAAFESGLYGVVRATQMIGQQMTQRKRGTIINVASMYGLVSPHPALYAGTDKLNPVTYGPMKASVIAFTRYVAAFWGSAGIRCNALAPGPFPNVQGSSANAARAQHPFLERVAQRTLLGRVGESHELVGPLLFLASDASSFMTGHVLVVDGGWVVT